MIENRESVQQHLRLSAKKIMNKKEIIKTTNMTIDCESLTIIINNCNDEVKLSLNEANLLFLLYNNPNKIYTKENIYQQCWEENTVASSVVTQTISQLRKKFFKYDIVIIDTIKQKGYKSGDRLIPLVKKHDSYTLIIIFMLLLITSFSLYYKNESRIPIEQNLIKLQSNVFMLSNSEHIDLDGINFKKNHFYFLNKEKNHLSVSSCLMIDNICNNSKNIILMLDDKPSLTPEIINSFTEKEITKTDRKLNTSDTKGYFNLQTNIDIYSLKEPNYSAYISTSLYFKNISDESYAVDRSINISESGYVGNYTIYSDININFDKESLIAEVINSDKQESLIQNGYISDQSQLKVFPQTFQRTNKYNYFHFYIIDDTFSLTYIENEKVSFIVSEHY